MNISPPTTFKGQPQLPGGLDIPIIHLLYEIYRRWHALIIKFPKAERYSLGQQCSACLLHLLEMIIQASTTADKAAKRSALRTASVKLDMLRLLIRLAKDCQCLTQRDYLAIQLQLHQVGKMLGGWLKSVA